MKHFSWILSRYIGRQFLVNMGLVFVVLASLIAIFDSLEMLRRTQDKSIPWLHIVELIGMKEPSRIQDMLVFVVLLGAMLCYFRLSRHSELVAVRVGGISAWQFLMPVVAIAAMLGVISITCLNPLSAMMLKRFEYLEGKYLRGDTSMIAVQGSGLWFKQPNPDQPGKTIIHALRMANQNTLYDATFYLFGEKGQFKQRISSPKATLVDKAWHLPEAQRTDIGGETVLEQHYYIPTTLNLQHIQERFVPPETVSFWQLPHFIHLLKSAGFSPLRHQLYWHRLLALPVLLSAVVFFAAIFSLHSPRKGKAGWMLSAGIFAGFVIYFVSDLVAAIGLSGQISVPYAVWTPPIISLLLGVWLIFHFEDG